MHCNPVRIALLDFANGETRTLRTWLIRRHLASCAGCAAELASLQEFKATLRRSDIVTPETITMPTLARRAPVRRVLVTAVIALLIGTLFLLPTLNRSRRNAQNPGTAIAAALARVNTWHFAGWKLIDGKQVSWEVWGRRTPWLYYERVGDSTTWSDGKQCLRVFAPNPALKRPMGLLIKTAADQVDYNTSFLEDPAYQIFVSDPQSHERFGDGSTTLFAQTPQVARFRRQNYRGMSGVNENKLYTISKRDWLPTTYQLHFENPKFARDTEYLHVDYEVDLPDSVVTPPAPNGDSVIDFTLPAKETVDPRTHIAESHGFQVQAEPVGMDKEGNVLIAVRGWLGGNRLLQNTAFTLSAAPPADQTFFFAGRGQQKVRYLSASNSSVPPGDSLYLPFMPLEPLEVAGALPETLALSLSASTQVQVRSSDRLDAAGTGSPEIFPENLFIKTFHWKLPLPKPVHDLAAVLPIGLDPKFVLPREAESDENRRIYYTMSDDFQAAFYEKVLSSEMLRPFRNPDGSLNYYAVNGGVPLQQLDAVRSKHAAEYKALEQSFRRKAVFWQRRKIEATSRMQDRDPAYKVVRIRNDTYYLAQLYKLSGDNVGMRRTLRQLLADTQNDPSFGDMHRQAQYTLHTGQFPSDADYKGPS